MYSLLILDNSGIHLLIKFSWGSFSIDCLIGLYTRIELIPVTHTVALKLSKMNS